MQPQGQHGKLQRFRESYTVNISSNQIESFAQPKLVESINGEKFEALVVLRRVPFSKYTEGINGRIYPRDLWEMHLSSLEGLPANDSHLDDPTPTQTIGVWHNFIMDDMHPYADLYITHEQIARNIRAGLKTLGVSTSAWGEIIPGTNIVNKESFSAQSIDAVYNPSMQVFLNREQILEESVSKQNNRGNTIMGNLTEAVNRISEANLKNEINNALLLVSKSIEKKDIEKIKEAEEQLGGYLGILEETSILPGIQDKIKGSISSIKSFFSEHLTSQISSLEEATSKIEEMKKKIDEQSEIITNQKEDISKLKEALDEFASGTTVTEVVQEDMQVARKIVESLSFYEKENKYLKKENENYKIDLTVFKGIAFSQDERLNMYESFVGNLKPATNTRKVEEKSENFNKYLTMKFGSIKENTNSKKEKLYESIIRNPSEVERYYKKIIEKNPFLKHFEERILGSKSLEEAMNLVEEIKTQQKHGHSEDIISLNESVGVFSGDDFVGTNRY